MSAGQGELVGGEKAPSASLRSAPPSSREDSICEKELFLSSPCYSGLDPESLLLTKMLNQVQHDCVFVISDLIFPVIPDLIRNPIRLLISGIKFRMTFLCYSGLDPESYPLAKILNQVQDDKSNSPQLCAGQAGGYASDIGFSILVCWFFSLDVVCEKGINQSVLFLFFGGRNSISIQKDLRPFAGLWSDELYGYRFQKCLGLDVETCKRFIKPRFSLILWDKKHPQEIWHYSHGFTPSRASFLKLQ